MKKTLDRYAAPLFDRFSSGLFYPAILGTNIIFLFQFISTNTPAVLGNIDTILIPWLLTLVLFCLDYVAVVRESPSEPPYGNVRLSVIDLLSAITFTFAHAEFALSVQPGTPRAVSWPLLWFVLLILHILYVRWYVVRKNTHTQALPKEQYDKAGDYESYLGVLLNCTWIQIAVFGCISIGFFFLKAQYVYICLCIMACIGWFVRQWIEYSRSPFKEQWH